MFTYDLLNYGRHRKEIIKLYSNIDLDQYIIEIWPLIERNDFALNLW